MNEIFGVIYKIENKVNNKIYIGQTIRSLVERKYEHKRLCEKNVHYNNYFLNAVNKYGWESFEFTIVDTAKNINELNDLEIFYIQKYSSTNRNLGYNLEFGGRNSKPNRETLKKMSMSHTGIKQTDSWINNRISKAGTDDSKKYGKLKSEEEKKALSKSSPKFWLGKNRDIETINKISKTKKKNGLSDKQKKILYKPVYRINILTNEIQNFDSTVCAGKLEKVNQSTISRWCMKNRVTGIFRWTYSV